MSEIKFLLIQPLLRLSIPLFLGGTYHLLKAYLSSESNNIDGLIPYDDSGNHNLHGQVQSNEGSPLSFPNMLDQISFGVYSNFSAFLLAMLLIDVIFKVAQQGMKGFWKEVLKSIPRFGSQNDSVITISFDKEALRLFKILTENQIIRILSYILIFVMIQISGFCVSFAQSEAIYHDVIENVQPSKMMMNMNREEDFLTEIPRILEQEGEISIPPAAGVLAETSFASREKFSLSMGTVLGSLNIEVYDMVLSKDRKTAFVILSYYGTLNIIDISDLKNPTIKSSLSLKALPWSYRVKSLALSSDEKTLYATSCKDLEIIDVTDLDSPKIISTTSSQILTGMEQVSSYKLLKPTLIVDEKREILFIGGLGLQIYDISNPRNPALLSARKIYQDKYKELSVNELCLSHDRQVLFIANGTLDVYDVSNPKDLKPLHSLKTDSSSRSILLSDDGKTVFLVGVDSSEEILFEEVGISDPKDSISVRKTTKLGFKNKYNPRFLGVYPSKTKFFISVHNGILSPDLLVFDSSKQKTTMNEKDLIDATNTIYFSSDGKTLITSSSSQLMVIELLRYYPNSRIFSGTAENLKANITLPSRTLSFEVSKDEQFLFILRADEDVYSNRYRFFEIWSLRNLSSPELLTSYHCDTQIVQMSLTKNSSIVYLRTQNSILELDVSDKSSPLSVKRTYQDEGLESFVTSPDEKTAFYLKFKNNIGEIKLLNLENFEEISKLDKKFESQYQIILPKDDKTLLVIDEDILFYNISNLQSPTPIISFSFIKNEPRPVIHSTVLSSDSEIFFLETFDQSGFRKLRIYNISDVKSPQLISEKYFTRFETFKILNRRALFSLSADQKMGFVPQTDSLIKVNLTDLKNPEVVGIVPLSNEGAQEIEKYITSADGNRIFTTIKNHFHIVNPNVKYSLYLNKEKFLLGEKYSDKILMLNRTSEESDYNIMRTHAYKIIKVSLLDMKIIPSQYTLDVTASLLPSWITFDSERDTLNIEPKKLRDIGTYALHAAFSLKVPLNIFDNSSIGEIVVSENLIAWLISLDYLDSELFLTAKFKSIESFYLPVQFFKYKSEIYNILKGFYVETCTLFEVGSSLVVNENDLKVSTLSANEIKAEIKLEPAEGTEAKFVNVLYGGLLPVIRENKNKAVFEGTISEINTALKAVVVNYENGTSCNASLVINDGFNPAVSMQLTNISNHFRANKQPRLNHNIEKTLQEQVDSADIQTGKYFTFTLTDDIFKDDYAESLTYELVMEKNNTGFPHWLSFNGLTLKGTPPEEILGRDVDFILIAQNEFKQYEVAFKLHIKISVTFWLKLLLKYSPYILTFIGLFVSANKIYDILAKRQYKHPKEYHIVNGEEISPEVIQPILFIQEELRQSQLILKYFSKEGAGGGLKDFVDQETGVLDKQKIKEEVKESVQRMPFNEREGIIRYPNGVIDAIIVNKFVRMQLDSDKQTKGLFEKLESKCLEVIERDVQSSEFVINQRKLNEMLALSDDENTSNNNDLEESLISGVNLELLKDALLAYAFEKHSIDISPVNVDIEVKQQVRSRFLFKFLKLDLRSIYFNEKNKIDYGINYRIIDDKLLFYGVTQSYFQSKTLAIQIKNRRHKIMKEIWIHGASNDSSGGVMRESRSQQQEYEIF